MPGEPLSQAVDLGMAGLHAVAAARGPALLLQLAAGSFSRTEVGDCSYSSQKKEE